MTVSAKIVLYLTASWACLVTEILPLIKMKVLAVVTKVLLGLTKLSRSIGIVVMLLAATESGELGE